MAQYRQQHIEICERNAGKLMADGSGEAADRWLRLVCQAREASRLLGEALP